MTKKTPGGPPPRIFYGFWVVVALSVIVFFSAGIRFTIGPFLEPGRPHPVAGGR